MNHRAREGDFTHQRQSFLQSKRLYLYGENSFKILRKINNGRLSQQPIHHRRDRRSFAGKQPADPSRQGEFFIAQAGKVGPRFAVAIQPPRFEAERLFQLARGLLAERTARSQQRREMLFGDACLYRRRRQRLEFIQHPPQVRLAYLSDIHVITIKKEFTLSTAYFKLPCWSSGTTS